MYSQSDRKQAHALLCKRRLVTFLPSGTVIAGAIIAFWICQAHRMDWGWVFACASSMIAGAYVVFIYGVYLQPMRLYCRHVDYMLEGHKRETTGILTEVADQVTDKDGLDCFAMIINIGTQNNPEDDRLFYYDALKGTPLFPLGTRVTVLSNDKMVAELRGAL